MSIEERLVAVREELRALLREAGPTDGLPAPEFRTADQDAVPGAAWRTGWRLDRRDVEVIASVDDVGSDVPGVFIRGISLYDSDVISVTPDEAVRIGRALLAAAAMTGSELIRQQVEARTSRRPAPRRRSPT